MLAEHKVRRIEFCRLCSSPRLDSLFSLGDLYVSDFLEKGEEGIKAPIELVLCRNCTLVQLRHTAPQEILYSRHYWYRSGVTQMMQDALRDITSEIESYDIVHPGDLVLDIGSNDGTLLRSYSVPRITRVGVEPALNLAEEGKQGLDYFINDFWDIKSFRKAVGHRKQAKVITAIGMFYDLDDPSKFIKDVSLALDDNGIFVAQLMCLKNMLSLGDAGNLCHEHLEYYSLESLRRLFGKFGLEIFDIEENAVNGESYRIWVQKKWSTPIKISDKGSCSEDRLVEAEKCEYGFDDPAFYKSFFRKIENNKSIVASFVKEQIHEGKRVWVYGASTKGNTLLQYWGLDHNWIDGASDRSPEKWGKYTVGTNIPIYSEADARKENPEYFLVLPYAFINEFILREVEWLNNGGVFFVPLPEPRSIQSYQESELKRI